MSKDTKVEICNKALMILGIEEDVENIDKPSTRWEKRCAMYYDAAREQALTQLIPSFAITSKPVRITRTTDGEFLIPQDCLRVLRVNNKGNNFHEIGGTIQCDFITDTYIDILYVRNIEDTGLFPNEFSLILSNELAILLAPLTKDQLKINYANTTLVQKRREYAGVNAQKTKIKKIEKRPFIGMGWFYH